MNLRLSALAVVFLAAGIAPWFIGGPLVARLFSVPFLLLGVFVAAVAYRLRDVRPRLSTADFPQMTGGCACGGGGCCGGAAQPADVELGAPAE